MINAWLQEQVKKWESEKYYFDKEEALRFYKFTQKLTLDKGKKNQKIKLLKFQFDICTDILCVKRKEDKLRRFREAHINIARKNGKSFIIALILTYLYFFRTEYGAEYIITANTAKQAALLYNSIKHFINNSPLKTSCKITDSLKLIYRKDENSYLRVLSSDASSADSYADFVFCMDEVHEAPDQLLYDKLKTGQGIFDEPLGITISTASNGHDPLNLEMELYKYSKMIESGEIEDSSFYYAIFAADEGCDILDESQWYKANPAKIAIDIHHNSMGGTGTNEGFQIIHYQTGDSKTFAYLLAEEFEKAGQKKDRVFTRNGTDGRPYYYWIRDIPYASIISEFAFIDNINDANKIKNHQWLEKEAVAICKALLRFLGKEWMDERVLSDETLEKELIEQNKKLVDENKKLREVNEILRLDNEQLKKDNESLKQDVANLAKDINTIYDIVSKY